MKYIKLFEEFLKSLEGERMIESYDPDDGYDYDGTESITGKMPGFSKERTDGIPRIDVCFHYKDKDNLFPRTMRQTKMPTEGANSNLKTMICWEDAEPFKEKMFQQAIEHLKKAAPACKAYMSDLVSGEKCSIDYGKAWVGTNGWDLFSKFHTDDTFFICVEVMWNPSSDIDEGVKALTLIDGQLIAHAKSCLAKDILADAWDWRDVPHVNRTPFMSFFNDQVKKHYDKLINTEKGKINSILGTEGPQGNIPLGGRMNSN